MKPRITVAVAAAILLVLASTTLLAQTSNSTSITAPAASSAAPAATTGVQDVVKAEVRATFSQLLDGMLQKVFEDLRTSLGLPPAGTDPADPLAFVESTVRNAVSTWAQQVGGKE